MSGATSVALPYARGLSGTGTTVLPAIPFLMGLGEHRGFGFGH